MMWFLLMQQKELEVYSEDSNLGIVRMPSRRFPGCVVQGDSLYCLVQHAWRIHELARTTGNQDLIDETQALVESLTGRLNHYEVVLGEHGIELPYSRSG